jgi:hypothetical protein
MAHPIACRCGTLKGSLENPRKAVRGICYCKDCQAFAHFLGQAGTVLDAQGGSDVLAVHPGAVQFSQGQHALACMSLSDKGMLRWYASCCNTPIGNTGRDPKMAHVGLLHSCMGSSVHDIERDFGPVRMRVQTRSARGDPKPRQHGLLAVLPGFALRLLAARIGGSWRHTPFFGADGMPVVTPTVLDAAQRAALDQAVGAHSGAA